MPLITVTLVLTVIFTTYSMTRFLDKAAEGALRTQEVLQLTVLKSLIALEVLVPVGLYIGLVVALGRLYSDWEMTALRSFGYAEGRILAPIVALAAAVALLVGAFSLVGRPWAYTELYRMQVVAEATADLERVRPGRFHLYDDDNRVVFIQQVAPGGGRIAGLFVRSREGDDLEVISAPAGTVREFVTPDNHELDLERAEVYRVSPDGSDFLGVFGRLRLLVPVAAMRPVEYRPKAQGSFDLRHSGDGPDRAELQWRLSTPVSTLLLALLAVPLGRSRPRQGRFARLTLAVIIYAVYFNLLGIGRTWVEQNEVQSLWWVPALFGAAVVAAYLPWPRWFHAWRRS